MSQENVEVALRLYAALNGGVAVDEMTDELLAIVFDPAIEMQQLSSLAGTTGRFRGYEGLRDAQRELEEALSDNRWEPLEHVANGDRVGFAVKASGRGRASGVRVARPVGHLFELRGGRISRWIVYPAPEQALQAVGVSE
jgi:ketosteroid isomerase-like protein